MNSKVPLHTVRVASTSFQREAHLDDNIYPPAIRFRYKIGGVLPEAGIRFVGLCATRTRAERCCTVWHIEGAYDTLVEVENSSWIAEIRADTTEQWRDHWEMHHYLIYLDSVGAFEVIAQSWEVFEQVV